MRRVGQPVLDVLRRVGVDRIILLGCFVATRVAYGIAGVRYDASGLEFSSQLLDQALLRDRLLESVWYLHAQPPAFNLAVGIGLRWSPLSPGLTFQVAFLVCGLALVLGLHDLAGQLRLGRVGALVVAVLVGCAPATVLHESWLSYEYPVATMLVLMVDAAVRYARRGSTLAMASAVALATVTVLTRSLLHPVWLIAVLGVLLLYRRPPSRVMLATCSVAVVVVGAFVLKNAVLFGSPQLSSWFGYNVNKVVVEPLTDAQRRQLADEGVLRPRQEAPCSLRRPDVPALAEEFKSPDLDGRGEPVPNYNYECLIARYDALLGDAVATARAHPGWVAKNVGGSFEIWASPSTLSPFVYLNRQEIGALDELVRRTLLLDVAWDPPIAIPEAWPVALSAPDRSFHVSLTIVLSTLVAVAGALAAAFTWRRRTPARFGVLIGGGTVAFVTLAGNLFEYGENNRIRFVVEPLTLVLAVAILAEAVRRARARARGRTVDS